MKTAVIFTGGTIGSSINGKYIETDLNKKYSILENYNLNDFDLFEPYTLLSENLNGSYLNKLIECIYDKLNSYDGIIICHGTDTLQYSACSVSYTFGNDTIPIMFVSSNYILEDKRANGIKNFKYAFDFIKNKYGKGTFISYKNEGENPKIHRAVRVLSHSQYDDKIISLNGEYGMYINNIFYKNTNYIELPDETKPFDKVDFTSENIIKLNAYPDMIIPNTSNPILIESYHSGTLSQDAINKTTSQIYITGSEMRIQYESTKSFLKSNIHILRKAVAPAMYIKLLMCTCSKRLNDINSTLCSDFVE